MGYPWAISATQRCLLPRGNRCAAWRVQPGTDDIEREAIRAEGYDPDDPAVIAAIDMVWRELAAVSNFVEFSQLSVSITRDGATVRWSQEMPHPGTG